MKKLFLVLMGALLLWSCSDDKSSSEENTSTSSSYSVTDLSASSVVFTAEGGSTTVSFTAGASWVATASQSWCTVAATSGLAGSNTITITADANTSSDERNASVTILCGTASAKVTVTQKQAGALTVTSNKIEMDSDGGEASIVATYTDDLSYEIASDAQSWISYKTTRASSTSTLVFTVAENTNSNTRQGTITLSNGTLSETVTIYQSGFTAELVVSQNSYTVESAGGTISVELKSNVDYTVEMPNVSWITASNTRASSTYTLYYDIAENEEFESRSATIKYVNSANSLSESVTITQEANDTTNIENGDYKILQQATDASGNNKLNVFLVGDGWTLEDHKTLSSDGVTDKYMAYMAVAMDSLFALEPLKSCRDMFNVYAVRAISDSDYATDSSSTGKYFGIASDYTALCSNAYALCQTAATKAAADGITIYTDYPQVSILYNCSSSVVTANCSWNEDHSYVTRFSRPIVQAGYHTLVHESGGHGIGHLADEYTTKGTGGSSSSYAKYFTTSLTRLNDGWYMNCDIESSASSVKWKYFITASAYKSEGISVVEGCYTYSDYFYRPSSTSLMKSSTKAYFNAPSREAIWRQIHRLAGDEKYYPENYVTGDTSNAGFAEFLEYDSINHAQFGGEPEEEDTRSVNAAEWHAEPIHMTIPWQELAKMATKK